MLGRSRRSLCSDEVDDKSVERYCLLDSSVHKTPHVHCQKLKLLLTVETWLELGKLRSVTERSRLRG